MQNGARRNRNHEGARIKINRQQGAKRDKIGAMKRVTCKE